MEAKRGAGPARGEGSGAASWHLPLDGALRALMTRLASERRVPSRVQFAGGPRFLPAPLLGALAEAERLRVPSIAVELPTEAATVELVQALAARAPGLQLALRIGCDPGTTSPSVDGEQLERVVTAALAALGSLEVVAPLDEAGMAAAPLLAALVTRHAREAAGPLRVVYELPAVTADTGAMQPSTTPVPLRALRDLPPALARHLRQTAGVRSRVGEPLCLFPHRLEQALVLRRPVDDAPPDAAFASPCEGCALRPLCPGASAAWLARSGAAELHPFVLDEPPAPSPPARTAAEAERVVAALPWEARLRWLLIDQPERSVRLGDLVRNLPDIACVRPWRRLEMHSARSYGPCCADYMAVQARGGDESPEEAWHGPLLREFRRALGTEERPHTCASTCPVLASRSEAIDRLWLHGGTEALVETQLAMARALVERRVEVDYAPPTINLSVTTYCNYDCLMCEMGRTGSEAGSLRDELPATFYRELEGWMDRLIVLDANGGEPLASPVFRAFVEELAERDQPSPLCITTNGSYLAPAWLRRFPRLPFHRVTVSLNAATARTYEEVNRGHDFATMRAHLDALLALRAASWPGAGITYSMVVLRRNLDEIEAFAELAERDGVEVRFLLPNRDRGGQSIFTSREAMTQTATALESVAERLDRRGAPRQALDARGCAAVLRGRLSGGLLLPIRGGAG